MNKYLLITCLIGLGACASRQHKVFLDSSTGENSPPAWARETKTGWQVDKVYKFKSLYVGRGDERVGGCFDMARLDLREALLTEISIDIKGSIENATSSISEDAENFLSKVRSGSFKGRVMGLRAAEQYFERYRIGETERLNCHVLGEIKVSEYERLRSQILHGVIEVDPRLKDAALNRQIEFMGNSTLQKSAQTSSNETRMLSNGAGDLPTRKVSQVPGDAQAEINEVLRGNELNE